MADKKNNRADKFMWKDGDLKILYNPNEKKKPEAKKPENKTSKK